MRRYHSDVTKLLLLFFCGALSSHVFGARKVDCAWLIHAKPRGYAHLVKYPSYEDALISASSSFLDGTARVDFLKGILPTLENVIVREAASPESSKVLRGAFGESVTLYWQPFPVDDFTSRLKTADLALRLFFEIKVLKQKERTSSFLIQQITDLIRYEYELFKGIRELARMRAIFLDKWPPSSRLKFLLPGMTQELLDQLESKKFKDDREFSDFILDYPFPNIDRLWSLTRNPNDIH